MPGEVSITSDYADDTTLMAESEEELKSLLMKVKEESEKVNLKLNIQKKKKKRYPPVRGIKRFILQRPHQKRVGNICHYWPYIAQ